MLFGKVIMRLILFIALALLTGCASHNIKSWKCKQGAGKFTIPDGWEMYDIKAPSEVQNLITPIGKEGLSDPGISLDAYCSFDKRFPETQRGCAESYLDGIHDVKDDTVKLEEVGNVSNESHGEITIFRYYSDWYGDHLVAMIVDRGIYATAELWTETEQDRKTYRSGFEEFVRGVRLKPAEQVAAVQPTTALFC